MDAIHMDAIYVGETLAASLFCQTYQLFGGVHDLAYRTHVYI